MGNHTGAFQAGLSRPLLCTLVIGLEFTAMLDP